MFTLELLSRNLWWWKGKIDVAFLEIRFEQNCYMKSNHFMVVLFCKRHFFKIASYGDKLSLQEKKKKKPNKTK